MIRMVKKMTEYKDPAPDCPEELIREKSQGIKDANNTE